MGNLAVGLYTYCVYGKKNVYARTAPKVAEALSLKLSEIEDFDSNERWPAGLVKGIILHFNLMKNQLHSVDFLHLLQKECPQFSVTGSSSRSPHRGQEKRSATRDCPAGGGQEKRSATRDCPAGGGQEKRSATRDCPAGGGQEKRSATRDCPAGGGQEKRSATRDCPAGGALVQVLEARYASLGCRLSLFSLAQVGDVTTRWRSIRDQYRRERQQRERSGAGAPPKKRKYVYFDRLTFLNPSMDLRLTQSNLTDRETGSDSELVIDPVGEGEEVAGPSAAPSGSIPPGSSQLQLQQNIKRPHSSHLQHHQMTLEIAAALLLPWSDHHRRQSDHSVHAAGESFSKAGETWMLGS
ncbi:unnamed protein product [Ranitomeya imitator]|uniref:MADF domain-containing protein n=1 Tax=Ranitomeya imitator TaxID=111125 RepID=A0ABN9MD19_9NEOB|nr:unnamed protein product [Ranitomeya imitator]